MMRARWTVARILACAALAASLLLMAPRAGLHAQGVGWNFFEGFDGAFGNAWSGAPGSFPSTPHAYLGAPSGAFVAVAGAQTYRMTNSLSDVQRVGLVSVATLPGSFGRLEARINTLTQDSTRVDGLFELWLLNSSDVTKYVRVLLFGANFSASRVWATLSSTTGDGTPEHGASQVINYANDTWYRLRIDSTASGLRASIWNDAGTTEIAGHTFVHSLGALGSTFRIGIAQVMGAPGGTFITDGAVDSVRATPFSVPVVIDIKPGAFPNAVPDIDTLNLSSNGVTPVALFTTPTFDASTVDVSSVLFAAAPPLRSTQEDVDGDGDLDMVLHFDTDALDLTCASTEATLSGEAGGVPIQGTDMIRVLKDKNGVKCP